jgi:hypothetical protein
MFLNCLGRAIPAALLIATAAASTAYASTDGQLGTTSTGTVNITASVASRVQISGLRDVTFLNVDPNAAQLDAQSVCVWSNSAGRKYNITATGSGTNKAFTLASTGLNPVAYSVEWAALPGRDVGSPLTASAALAGQISTATAPTCTSGPAKSASLIVKMAEADLQTMQAGASYNGVLTLVVAPE